MIALLVLLCLALCVSAVFCLIAVLVLKPPQRASAVLLGAVLGVLVGAGTFWFASWIVRLTGLVWIGPICGLIGMAAGGPMMVYEMASTARRKVRDGEIDVFD